MGGDSKTQAGIRVVIGDKFIIRRPGSYLLRERFRKLFRIPRQRGGRGGGGGGDRKSQQAGHR